MTAPDPLAAYYATEYHRRNMQVARVCGANAAVDQALERALAVKGLPKWLIAYLESAAERLPGLQHDLAAWRNLAPDAPDHVRHAPTQAADAALERAAQYHDAEIVRLEAQIEENREYLRRKHADAATYVNASEANDYCRTCITHHRMSAAAIRALQSAPSPTALQAALAVPEVRPVFFVQALLAVNPSDPQWTMVHSFAISGVKDLPPNPRRLSSRRFGLFWNDVVAWDDEAAAREQFAMLLNLPQKHDLRLAVDVYSLGPIPLAGKDGAP